MYQGCRQYRASAATLDNDQFCNVRCNITYDVILLYDDAHTQKSSVPLKDWKSQARVPVDITLVTRLGS